MIKKHKKLSKLGKTQYNSIPPRRTEETLLKLDDDFEKLNKTQHTRIKPNKIPSKSAMLDRKPIKLGTTR